MQVDSQVSSDAQVNPCQSLSDFRSFSSILRSRRTRSYGLRTAASSWWQEKSAFGSTKAHCPRAPTSSETRSPCPRAHVPRRSCSKIVPWCDCRIRHATWRGSWTSFSMVLGTCINRVKSLDTLLSRVPSHQIIRTPGAAGDNTETRAGTKINATASLEPCTPRGASNRPTALCP